MDTTVNYLHLDHLGSTSVVTDTSGTQTETIRYFPFGATRSGSVTSEKKFTGQRLDGTGLYYYEARYYDPIIGRFNAPDTTAPDLMNPQSLNKYSYCFNNPLKYNDPTGHWPNWAKIGQAIVSAAKTVVNVVKENIDTIQTVLDAAGMIPVIGEICDVASGVISVAKGDWGGAVLSLASVIPVIGSASGAAKLAKNAVKLVNKADDIIDATRTAGKVGEEASGIIRNTEHIKSFTPGVNYRIPDGLDKTRGILSEVKNVKYQALTKQIRDYLLYSQQKGFIFELWTRSDTVLSDTLQELIDSGYIIHRTFNP